ncbi:MAG: hypothetical protein ACQER9_00010 [Nanobdellota archaeon]
MNEIKKTGLLVLTLIIILSLTSHAQITKTSEIGLPSNTARIFDFDNDGEKEALAFSDKIDSTLSKISYWDYDGNYYLKQNITKHKLKRCSLSYQDYNLDGKIDIFYTCMDNKSKIISALYQYNGTQFQLKKNFTPYTLDKQKIDENAYGDTIFFDLNNDGYSDIANAFLSEGQNLSIFYYNQTSKDFNKKTSRIPLINNTIKTFFIKNIDYDADGDFDIITYSYDDDHFDLFENQICNTTSCSQKALFRKVNNSKFINNTFFEEKHIKSLNIFDENKDGFPDLYYIVDKGARDEDTRNLEFGYFLNKHRRMNHTFSITIPSKYNFTYTHSSTKLINESWENYSGKPNHYQITIKNSNYTLSTGRTQKKNIFYNLNITAEDYSNGEYFTNNYDYNSRKGNLLYRKKLNLTIPNQCYNYTLQAESPNLLRSNISKKYNYSDNLEYCDGYDNNCDGKIDEAFNYTWPDGNKTLVKQGFDYDGDGFFPQYYTINHTINESGNITQYQVTFNCTLKKQRENTLYDTNDYDKNIIPIVNTPKETIKSDKSSGNTGSISIREPTEKNKTEKKDKKDEKPKPQEKQTEESSSKKDTFAQTITKELSNKKFSQKTTIEHHNGKTVVTEEIKNIDIYPLNKVKLRVKIPKYISRSAEYIKSPINFNIIQMDPIIDFEIGKIDSFRKKTIQYKFDKEISEEDAKFIQSTITYKNTTKEEKRQIEKNINDTKKTLNISQKTKVKDNKTIVTLDLNPQNESAMYNVSVFQQIPKCLIEIINDEVAESDVKFDILNADPLIVWHFDKLIDKQKIQLSINSVADSNCSDMITTKALARQIVFSEKKINYTNVAIGLLFIPLIGFIFILLSNLTKKAPEKTNKKGIIGKIRKFFNKINFKIHELILIVLIILNILDFIELLPGDIDYFKKIISWIILGYVLYDVSITGIVTGIRDKTLDIALIISFFMLTLKNLVGFAKVAIHEVNLMKDLYSFIWKHNTIFEINLFLLGIAGIFICSYILAKKESRNPSIIATFIKKQTFFKNFTLIFIVLSGFFITVFNLMFEWLAIAVDAFILVTTMIFIIFIIIKHHKHFKKKSKIIEDISEKPEEFYEKVISLFHYRKFIPLAFSGLLILFMLTEIANFLIPYLTGIYDIIYFGNFTEQHIPIFNIKEFFNPDASLFALKAAPLDLPYKALVFSAYCFNFFALIYLLILPARYWYNYFVQKDKPITEIKHFHLSPGETGFFFASLIIYLLKPAFGIQKLKTYDIIAKEKTLVGVNITTKLINLDNLPIILLVAVIGGIIITFLAFRFKKQFTDYLLLASLIFFITYIFKFFSTQLNYYTSTIISLITSSKIPAIIIGIFFILLFIISFISIYGIGFATMIYLYLPTSFQHCLTKMPFFKVIFHTQKMHHISHRNSSGDYIKNASEFIKKSLKSKHELYYIVEHLEKKGWSIEEIEEAVSKTVKDEEIWKGFDHYKHYHHNKKIIHALRKYIKKEHKTKNLEEIIENLKKLRLDIKDIVHAIRETSKEHQINKPYFKPGFQEEWTHHKLIKILKKAEKEGISFKELHGSFKYIKSEDGKKLAEDIAEALLERHSKLSDLAKTLKNFKVKEDDIRVALKTIRPKNEKEEEIVRYL